MTKPVADGSDAGDGADRLPGVDSGVAAPAAKDQKNQPQANEGTFTKAEVDALLAEQKAERERDIGAVRSDLMKSQNAQRAEWEQADALYREQIHNLTVKDMDENTRNAYESQINAQRAEALAARLRQTEEQLQLSMQMGQYVQHLGKQFGVKIEDLDMSDMDRLSESAWDAAARSHQEALQELETLKATRQEQKSGATMTDVDGLPEAPDVVTQQGTAPASVPTLEDLRRSVSPDKDNLISEDDLFTMAENPELTGVDLNVVLQALAAEIEATSKED